MASTEKLLSEKAKAKTKRGRPSKTPNSIHCIYHGDEVAVSSGSFYMANPASIWKNAEFGKIPICKNCIDNIYINYYTRSQNTKWSVYKMCERLDIPFINNIYDGAMKEKDNDWQKVFGAYIKTFNSFASKNKWEANFDLSEEVELDFTPTSECDIKGITNKLSNADKRAKRDVENQLGYDPFDGYSETDQKFLYNELINYLDEETVEDAFKVSQIIQICANNNQINKYNYIISQYSSDPKILMENTDKLKSLNSLIKDIVMNNDKIAKENGVSEKNKTNKSQNKSTLAGKMKYLSSLNFDEVEVDFYNQKKAYGMQVASEISLKAIAEQIRFDDNDANEIITYQRDLIKTMENKISELKEELRVYAMKCNKEV